MKRPLSFLLPAILAMGLASPAAGGAPRSESEPEWEWLRPNFGEFLSYTVHCDWECNDGSGGGCYPPADACWYECESACSAHGGVDICYFQPLPPG